MDTFPSQHTYRTSHISFYCSGEKEYSNWDGHPLAFTNIVSAISRSSLKQSLRTIDVWGCGDIDQKYATQVVESFHMHNLTVKGS